MSYQGFGKGSGPSAPPKLQPAFGNFSRPLSAAPPSALHSFPDAPAIRSPSQHDFLGKVQSHPMAFQTIGPAPGFHQQSTAFDRGPGTPGRMRSPSLGFESTRPAAAASYSHLSAGPYRPIPPPPISDKDQRSFIKDVDARRHLSPGIASVATLQNSERVVGEGTHLHAKSTRSPTYMSGDEKLSRNSGQPVIRRPISPSPTLQNQPKFQEDHANPQGYQDQSPFVRSYDHDTNVLTEFENVQAPKRIKSPELPFPTDFQSGQINLQRSFSRSNAHEVVGSMKSIYSESAAAKATSFLVPKRTRSPPLPSSDHVFHQNSFSTRDDTERERLAKAKRLARFKDELGETAQSNLGSVDERDKAYKNEHMMAERTKNMSNQSLELSGNLADGNLMADYEGLESSSIISGLCPDMCPESERAERERKGDLDHYERLDGDRNQTTKFLAVKKYNRTAEREANLIRPLPILLKTIDYLLNLLSQPYDEKFLGIYNFLWDRMRAIRMDLRMQHIFNENAITMLEQMIRLHIIAMHELCEFSKGEGFAEGFDAHLNIEQMNKTSVELFQMYDDHRKRGIDVSSEKEFRGYYALLKLDKHPGYKVEPAELSLDLAKMTPEMRQTPEVKFARDVARACRTGNFIAFFRLVRKASYLQACLMHAHFAKLRTQALASLHSGLQNNQGLPIAHICKWIGMEEEDIEGLLEYHGFLIKVFEEPYMVREGPFLNNDKDYATKCSKLVRRKRSRMIANDVSPCSQSKRLITGATIKTQLAKINKEAQTLSFEKKSSPRTTSTAKESPVHAVDEEMAEFDDELPPEDHNQVQPVIETPIISQFHEYNREVEGAFLPQPGLKLCEPLQTEVKFVGNYNGLFMTSPVRNISTGIGVPMPIVSEASLQDRSPSGNYDIATERSEPRSLVNNVKEAEDHLYASHENKDDIVSASNQEEEIASAKLKLILRLWRRRSLKKKQLREQRLLAANAAFNILSLGPPIQLNKDKIRNFGEFDIDHVMRERQKKRELSWSILNVSDVVASTLSRRNLDVKCICWKLVVCSQRDNGGLDQGSQAPHFAAGSWMLSKLMPSFKTDDLVFSSPCLSIWKNWVSSKTDADLSCCLSIVKETKFDHLIETVHGASAILFLVTESIPLELQRAQLHKLLISVPSGSCLPLLILSDFYDNEVSASSKLTNKLGLYNIDKSRICSFQVISLLENPHVWHLDGFFSDEKLKEGLKWLADESPLQPVLHRVKLLDLVIAHLNSSMEVLDYMKDKDVGPNSCISAFNTSLDQSLLDTTSAAKANPSDWPCPEIALLEESSDEHRMLTHVLPTVGWSSVENVEPLQQALMDLKLPTFPDDLSWLTEGSHMGKEIPTQREKLESCLISYLTQPSKIMGQQLAMKEARIMLQHCAKLELRKFDYFIVPDWVMIFRRIFNWRLRYLAGGAFSCVYIADCCHEASPTSVGVSNVRLESSEPPVYHLNQPLLDEIIEVGCSSLSIDQERELPETHQPLAAVVSNGKPPEVVSNAIDFVDDDSNNTRKISFVSSESVPNMDLGLDCTGKEVVVASRVNSEAVKLSNLLDRCSLIQNAIDEKLSIYF